MTIFILGMNYLQYLVCLDAKLLSFHRRPSGEKALSRFHMRTDSSGPSSLAIVLSSNFHEKRSWCRDVIKCYGQFVTKVFLFIHVEKFGFIV